MRTKKKKKVKITVKKYDTQEDAIHNMVKIFDEVYDEEMKCRMKVIRM